MPIALTNSQVYGIALDAEVAEHVVRCFVRGERIPSKLGARILHALIARDIDIAALPEIGTRPMLCRADADGPVAIATNEEDERNTTMQNTDNPTLAGCTQELRAIQKFKPQRFAELAKLISEAAADAHPDLSNHPQFGKLTDDQRKLATALRLTGADVATMQLRDEQQQSDDAAVAALSDDEQRALRKLFPDAAEAAQFLRSREGVSP